MKFVLHVLESVLNLMMNFLKKFEPAQLSFEAKNIESGSCEWQWVVIIIKFEWGKSSFLLGGPEGSVSIISLSTGSCASHSNCSSATTGGRGRRPFIANCHLSEARERERLSESSVSGWPFQFSSPLHFVAQTFVTDTRHRIRFHWNGADLLSGGGDFGRLFGGLISVECWIILYRSIALGLLYKFAIESKMIGLNFSVVKSR